MSSRSLLRRHIREAWRLSIRSGYAAQRINSERSLQASVWGNLNTLLPTATRRMFIEPCMSVGRQLRYPDIVICNTREVIGIVELKYQPRTKPSWEKDFSTFRWIDQNRNSIVVANSRFRGINVDNVAYPLSNDLLYVWAGVHATCELDLRSQINKNDRSGFLLLHAETNHSNVVTFRESHINLGRSP